MYFGRINLNNIHKHTKPLFIFNSIHNSQDELVSHLTVCFLNSQKPLRTGIFPVLTSGGTLIRNSLGIQGVAEEKNALRNFRRTSWPGQIINRPPVLTGPKLEVADQTHAPTKFLWISASGESRCPLVSTTITPPRPAPQFTCRNKIGLVTWSLATYSNT